MAILVGASHVAKRLECASAQSVENRDRGASPCNPGVPACVCMKCNRWFVGGANRPEARAQGPKAGHGRARRRRSGTSKEHPRNILGTCLEHPRSQGTALEPRATRSIACLVRSEGGISERGPWEGRLAEIGPGAPLAVGRGSDGSASPGPVLEPDLVDWGRSAVPRSCDGGTRASMGRVQDDLSEVHGHATASWCIRHYHFHVGSRDLRLAGTTGCRSRA